MMRTDAQIKQDILDAFTFHPNMDENQIGVLVKNGIVTLTGLFFSNAIKITVVKIIEKVAGVKAIAEGIKIGYMSNLNTTDTEIANAAINAIERNVSVPNGKVIVKVDNGWITLLGELEWAYEKDTIRRIAENVSGVKGITNNIILKKASIKPKNIKKKTR